MKKDREVKDVVDIKNHTADAIESVHAGSFIAFEILVYIGLDRVVLGKLLPETIWSEILRAVAFALGYILIYTVVKRIYSAWIIRKRRILDIAGDEPWYHVHIPDMSFSEDREITALSAGKTYISRNLNDFTFNAKNYKYTLDENGAVKKLDSEPSTTWCTETSEICEGNDIHIVEIYKASSHAAPTAEIHTCPVCKRRYSGAKTVSEAPRQRYGIHLYQIQDANKIICTYSDCWPSLKSGKLYLFRKEEDRDAKIREFFTR